MSNQSRIDDIGYYINQSVLKQSQINTSKD
jgi:hypothetical protein